MHQAYVKENGNVVVRLRRGGCKEIVPESVAYEGIVRAIRDGGGSIQYAAWDESKHPRGQPENAGEFADVVSKSAMDANIKSGERQLFRGVSQAKHADQFRTGKLIHGKGAYGNGIYTGYDTEGERAAKEYAGEQGVVHRLALKTTAKVISFDSAETQFLEDRAKLKATDPEKSRRWTIDGKVPGLPGESGYSLGDWARDNGFDAIDVEHNKYLVVVKTSALRSQKERHASGLEADPENKGQYAAALGGREYAKVGRSLSLHEIIERCRIMGPVKGREFFVELNDLLIRNPQLRQHVSGADLAMITAWAKMEWDVGFGEYAAHDVSGEPRDEGGKWTEGGASAPKEKATLKAEPYAVQPGNAGPKPKLGPDMNVIEGEIAGFPITTRERGLIQKVSKKTKDMLEEALSDPAIVQAMHDAGVKHLVMEKHAGANKPKTWTMAMSNGALMFHSQTGNKIEGSENEARRKGGIRRIIYHEAGHAIWHNASEEQKKAFQTALDKNPHVLEHVGKIVNINPPRNAFDHDVKARNASEAHAEINAMQHYDPEEYARLPEELRKAAEAIRNSNQELARRLAERTAKGAFGEIAKT